MPAPFAKPSLGLYGVLDPAYDYLRQHLVFCAPLWEGSGLPFDNGPCRMGQAVENGSGAIASWAGSPVGWMLDFPGGSAGSPDSGSAIEWNSIGRLRLDEKDEATFLLIYRQRSTNSDFRTLVETSGGGTRNFFRYQLQGSTDTARVASDVDNLDATFVHDANKVYSAAIGFNAATGSTYKTLFINGAQISSKSGHAAFSADHTYLYIGAAVTNKGNHTLDGQVGLVVVWNRLLRDDMLAQLTRNPWAILQPRRRRLPPYMISQLGAS